MNREKTLEDIIAGIPEITPAVRFNCRECDKELRLPIECLGKKVVCVCGHENQVPEKANIPHCRLNRFLNEFGLITALMTSIMVTVGFVVFALR